MKKMLVVDDEVDVCDFVKNFFSERDFQVFTALNGSEAIRIVRKDKPEIILLDIRMREMDGIEVLRRIRGIVPEPLFGAPILNAEIFHWSKSRSYCAFKTKSLTVIFFNRGSSRSRLPILKRAYTFSTLSIASSYCK